MIKYTKYHSKCINNIAKGCKYCVKGQKLVLFITGICPRSCTYCPLSDKKYHKDVIYANEKPIDTNLTEKEQIKLIIGEAKINQAKGAGITGGDPLCKLERTVFFIKTLKKEFGNHFHIHLYTSFDLINKDNLKHLFDAGLDEIRFHADINNKNWKKISLVKEHNWQIGIEIPVIPNKLKQTKELLEYFKNKVGFINLNELEIADNNSQELTKLGYETRDELSYGIKGSEKTALKLLEHLKDTKINVHYCTAKLKDDVQLRNRIKLRAKSVAKHYEQINEEGTITRAIIYLDEFKPSFNYQKEIEKVHKERFAELKQKLETAQEQLKNINIKSEVDLTKFRLIIHMKSFKKDKNIEKIKKLKLVPAIVEEYPTYDAMEVDINFL